MGKRSIVPAILAPEVPDTLVRAIPVGNLMFPCLDSVPHERFHVVPALEIGARAESYLQIHAALTKTQTRWPTHAAEPSQADALGRKPLCHNGFNRNKRHRASRLPGQRRKIGCESRAGKWMQIAA